MPSLDALHQIYHLALDPALGGVLVWVIRLLLAFRDHPPHSHVNGKIVYAKGFDPPKVEELKVNAERN